MFFKNGQFRHLGEALSKTAAVVALVSAMSFASSMFLPSHNASDDAAFLGDPDRELRSFIDQIDRLRKENDQLNQRLQAAKEPSKTSEKAELAALANRIGRLEASQRKLEEAVLQDPAKALALPMLSRDVAEQRARTDLQIAGIKAGVDQAYDLNKWLLGSMVLSILGIAVSNVLTSRSNKGG